MDLSYTGPVMICLALIRLINSHLEDWRQKLAKFEALFLTEIGHRHTLHSQTVVRNDLQPSAVHLRR